MGTIQARLKYHLPERNKGRYLKRVEREKGPLEVSWKALSSHDEAKGLERELLAKYDADHLESPPLNRQDSGKEINDFLRNYASLTPDDQATVREALSSRKPA